jgi:DNA-binding HxlR family transcriptional regulator
MKTYRQYCPIARTAELFAERWTPIIVRNISAGCSTFGELLAGAPGISKALLTERLAHLERHGIITARRGVGGRASAYELTQMGRELKAITDAMGTWGARWLELEERHIDAAYVIWATAKLVATERLPDAGLIVRVDLADRPHDRFWMLARRPQAEVCSTYPGDEDLVLETDSEMLARWHLRHVSYDAAVASGRLRLTGPRSATRAFLAALQPSPFARTGPGRIAGAR